MGVASGLPWPLLLLLPPTISMMLCIPPAAGAEKCALAEESGWPVAVPGREPVTDMRSGVGVSLLTAVERPEKGETTADARPLPWPERSI